MSQMENYHELLRRVLNDGVRQKNARTGKYTWSLPGAMLQYDLRQGFPAITTKKLYFDAVKGELLGFFRGYTNAADFRKLGCKIWDQNANETPAWLANPYREGTDDLGRIYGAQWTGWTATRFSSPDSPLGEDNRLRADGWEGVLDYDGRHDVTAYQKSINQVEGALRTLLHDPSSRRIIVSGWNVGELDQMALVPCHVLYQFLADIERKTLNLCMYIRSNDLFLGAPFNIASASLFLSVMAELIGYTPGTYTQFIADAHVYEDHLDQVNLQLTRGHFDAPKLTLDIDPVGGPGDIAGSFHRIGPNQIWLEGYQSHGPIAAPMAV